MVPARARWGMNGAMPAKRAAPPAPAPAPAADPIATELARLLAGEHHNPHQVLGLHETADGGKVVRAYRPGAVAMRVIPAGGQARDMERVRDSVFVAEVPPETTAYTLEAVFDDGSIVQYDDPYRFWPTVGDIDLHLFGEGRHRRLWQALGAHHRTHQGVPGTSFSVWAPSARSVRAVGDFNLWDGRVHPMRALGSSGVWEIFIPGVE